jgi:hypothetical protein
MMMSDCKITAVPVSSRAKARAATKKMNLREFMRHTCAAQSLISSGRIG